MERENCPHCNVSLIGEEIPKDILKHYGGATHWKREIGLEYPELYDGVWDWKCPDCGGLWDSEVKQLKEGTYAKKATKKT